MFHWPGPYTPLSCFAAPECLLERRQRRAPSSRLYGYPQKERGIPPWLHAHCCRDLAYFPHLLRDLPLTSRVGPVQALWVGASSLLHDPCFPYHTRHLSCTSRNHHP